MVILSMEEGVGVSEGLSGIDGLLWLRNARGERRA
jgi:hypothetical protein